MNDSSELLVFFKALADANRLKIIGLLTQQSYTVEQLAEILGLGASTVSHHLSKLSEAGLVSARAQSYYNYYSLENDKFDTMARQIVSKQGLPTAPPVKKPLEHSALQGYEADEYDRKVLKNYLQEDGRLKTIPSQRKKLMVVLRFLAHAFQPGTRYSEREVNETLARYHVDTASLRRELIGAHLMAREGGGGSYWRIDTPEASQ